MTLLPEKKIQEYNNKLFIFFFFYGLMRVISNQEHLGTDMH